MKRNESILVYSVTGLLVVILAVAILFGNERGAQAKGPTSARALDDLVGVQSVAEEEAGPALGAANAAPRGPGPNAGATDPASAHSPSSAGMVPSLDDVTNGSPPIGAGDDSNVRPVQVPLAAPFKPEPGVEPVTDPATQALVLLGDSRRDGDYRIVTVRHNDTFSELVQRWCGGLGQLEVAESLNEELNLARLVAGAKVCLPWVDDASLVAAHLARKTEQDAAKKVIAQARTQGQDYVVKAGDSLWGIAVRHVGQKGAPSFIDNIKALNPELLADPNRLVVGKTIVLPK